MIVRYLVYICLIYNVANQEIIIIKPVGVMAIRRHDIKMYNVNLCFPGYSVHGTTRAINHWFEYGLFH